MQGKHIVISAAGILAGGVCWAGALLMAPPPKSGDSEQIRKLAQAANANPLQPMALPQGVNVPTAPVESTETPVKVTPKIVETTPQRAAAPAAPVQPRKPGPANQTPPAPAAPAEDPVKSIALTGVTHEGGQDQALLLDLNTNNRETVRAGGSAFGFTVRKIEPESVVLARGSSQYTVRLGDKQVPTASTTLASAEDGDDFGGDGEGRRQFGRRGGFGGFGGGNDAERAQRRAEFFARMGGRFGGGRPGFGGGQTFGQTNQTSFSSGGNNDNGRSDGDRENRRRSWNNGGGFQPAFQPMPFMGGPGFFGMGRQNSNQSSFTNAPTTNPQTARRRGSTLVGGGNGAMDAPEPINNPQTQRRLGTSSNGPAFGQDQSSYNPYGNRTGTNRSGNTNGRGSTFR